MKNRIKFNNKQILKKCLILFIIGLCIYLLYLNDKIQVQSIIQNSLNANHSLIESFNVNKYVDICKNRETRFYDFRVGTSSSMQYVTLDGSNNCEGLCDTIPNCQGFLRTELSGGIIDPSKCYMYIGVLDASNIDRSNMSVKVNCNSKILPASSYTYNGIGYINKNYFEYNKSKFSYIDIYLDKANELIRTFRDTNTHLNSILTQNGADVPLIANIENNNNNIGAWITSFGQLIGADVSKLFTLNNSTNPFTDDMANDEKNKTLHKLYDRSKETPALDVKIGDIEKSNYANNLFYTILAFIMIITIIILVLYRFNENVIISDRFMIFYFIIIVSIFTFIRFMLNK